LTLDVVMISTSQEPNTAFQAWLCTVTLDFATTTSIAGLHLRVPTVVSGDAGIVKMPLVILTHSPGSKKMDNEARRIPVMPAARCNLVQVTWPDVNAE